jgi:hypothetical protein
MEHIEKIADKIYSISVSDGSLVIDQLKEIFSSIKKIIPTLLEA